jgi:hypothetical protein
VRRLAAFVAAALVVLAVACGKNAPDLLVRPYDAGFDAPVDGSEPIDGAPPIPDGGLGGPCNDDTQCDDHVACTFDLCNLTFHRCQNIPDDTRCDDGVYCDGHERCEPLHGCVGGQVVTCEDGKSCTIKRCVEASQSCVYALRDVDADGDPDLHCPPGGDCDDLNPRVSSQHAEVCANHVDDNCNGLVDETPCVNVPGDVCGTAIRVVAGSTVTLSTLGANEDYSATCSVSQPSGARDIVAVVTVPRGANKDLDVWATTQGVEVALAVDGTCGSPTSELSCSSAPGATAMRTRARNLAPGDYYILVTTQFQTSVTLQTTLLDTTPAATNVDCGSAFPIQIGTPTLVSIIDPPTNLPSACSASASTGELTYSFTLAQAADVRVYSSTVQGSGSAVVGLRDPHCTDAADELHCHATSSIPLFARALPPGTYVVTVAATAPIDVNLVVETSAPTAAPPDQTCAAPPSVVLNGTMPVDLSDHEDAIKDGCLVGGPTAAYDLSIANPSDVLVVGRFPQTEAGAVSLDTPVCDRASRVACVVDGTPVRLGKRNVAPGDYRVVLTDMLGATDVNLTTVVRDTVPPTIVTGADTCANAAVIPETGGFFTGDTTNATGNYPSPCDASSAPPTGEPDQVLSLTLTTPRRVIFDMEGSTYTTILDLRTGTTCPGTPLANGCYVGFSAQRSFLDLELGAGTYWVIVDGYGGGKGPWNLDVRVFGP